MTDKRVSFDFDVAFSNGGGIQGQGFRLDIDGDDIDDDALAAYIVSDLRLLMVGSVKILNKTIISERHKRATAVEETMPGKTTRKFDLSHVIETGMITYKGLPAPLVCDYLSRENSKAHYAEGTSFVIDRLEMVGNTGTYIDSPFHRYADGCDLAGLALDQISGVRAVVVRVAGATNRAVDWTEFAASNVKDKAVLVHTGWDRHWRTDAYFEGHPFLTEKAAIYLRDQGARLVGIDSLNIDDTSGGARPVHTILLGAGIPIVEHLTGLEQLPVEGIRFSAVPPKVSRMGTFPVRAHAWVDTSA